MSPERFAVLVQGYLDGTLTIVEREELAAELVRDPPRLDELLDQVRVAVACGAAGDGLRERLAELLKSPQPLDRLRLATSRRFVRQRPTVEVRFWPAAVAALLMVALGALAWQGLSSPTSPANGSAGTNGTGAVVTPVLYARAGDVVVRAQQRLRPTPGDSLALMVGDRLEIAGHGTRLEWPDGSTIAWEAQASVAIPRGSSVLAVESGRAICEVKHRPERVFCIEVPGGTVTDSGTSFTISVQPHGTAVTVTSGEVRLQSGQDQVVVAAGTDGYLGGNRAGMAPQSLKEVGFSRGLMISGDQWPAMFSDQGLLWGSAARIIDQDGVPTLSLTPDPSCKVSPWLMVNCPNKLVDWSRYRGMRFLVRGSGAMQLHLKSRRQPEGTYQTTRRFESAWQEAAPTWRLVTLPFSAWTTYQMTPTPNHGKRPHLDVDTDLTSVRSLGFRLGDAKARIEIQQLAFY